MKKGAGFMGHTFLALILIALLAVLSGLLSAAGVASAEGEGVDCTRLPCATDCYWGCAASQNVCLGVAQIDLEACLKTADSPVKINSCQKDNAARKNVCTLGFDSCKLDCITQCEGECDKGQTCVDGWCTVVPEPGTIFLAVSGLGVAGCYLRRWRPFARPH